MTTLDSNPFARATRDLSRQAALTKSDPALAMKLKAQALAADTATAPNPWVAGTRNLTLQAEISRRDPALAARLKAEAHQQG